MSFNRRLGLFLSPQYSDLIKREAGLIGYWKMNETSGNVVDSSPSKNNGVVVNTPIYSRPQLVPGDSKALTSIRTSGNGTGNYFNVGDLAIYQSFTAFTLEGWVNFSDATNSQPLFGRGSPGDTTLRGSYLLSANNGSNSKPLFDMHVGSEKALNGSVYSTGIHHLVGTWDGVTQKLYVDGVLDVSQAVAGTLTNNAYLLTLGCTLNNLGNPSGGVNTDIAHLAIYNVALNAAQISRHYHIGARK